MGDFSRNTFIATKHHSDVRLQQGRVLLDADWNEQMDIQKHRAETQAIDTIGHSGAPKADNGFEIGVGPAKNKLEISAGRFYVDGLLCELESPSTYFSQPHLPDFKTPYFGPPANPANPETRVLLDGNYLVYLDAWQQEINFHDDPYLQEVALGEADTCTRMQTVWQVELLKVDVAAPTTLNCETDSPEWNNVIAPVTGKMNVQTKRNTDPKNPCLLPPTTGFRRLENQFYRIEVQKGPTRANSTFKWSRDNATVETLITGISGTTVTVSNLGKDDVLGFATGQWVEISDDVSSLMGRPKALFQIISIRDSDLKITLDRPAGIADDGKKRKLRRWDQDGAEVSMNTGAAPGGWIDLEDGIQVSFSAGTYRPGDFWTFAARTATGEVEWPPFATPNVAPVPQLPAGLKHRYARLATIGVSGGTYTPVSCRKKFPSLTTITASDVAFDNANCQLPSAKNVQEAIDRLCGASSGSCTLTAVPGIGWESIFDQIADGQDAQICFQVGDYPLTNPAKVSKKGHLKLNGSGPGTRILAIAQEAGLAFDNCKSLLIRDLYVEAGIGQGLRPNLAPDLNGAITCIDCASVDIEQVDLKCNAGSQRSSTCLTIRNTAKSTAAVRVHSCDLLVGHQQQGILLVNVARAAIADNTLTVVPMTTRPTLKEIVADNAWRSSFRRMLFNSPVINERSSGSGNARILVGDTHLSFTTPSALRRPWQQLINSNPAPAGAAPDAILKHIEKLSDRLLKDPQLLSRHPAFEVFTTEAVKQLSSAAAQGITVGGTIAREIRIMNNTLNGFRQGIHVGLSHRLNNHEDLDQAGDVSISGNTVNVLLTEQAIRQDRHGIFVGNCKNLIIENNTITLTRLAETERLAIDGIRVWGRLGERMMITRNSIVSADGAARNKFRDGIRVNPLNEKPSTAQWVVMWNVAPCHQNPVIVENGAQNIPGTNTPHTA